ncbi:sensor histidine kinase [Sphingobacterium endophyticum]|uniref:sensor histidine kinase n=1 Tax=Sphingobacterium endophyticum TaxID=2546448 RepID=UPI0012E2F831|nr:sensor histidine kinase [Sphingobacterium endophyticum]
MEIDRKISILGIQLDMNGKLILTIFTILASVPMFWATMFYLQLVMHSTPGEELGFALTLVFFLLVYMGWFFSSLKKNLMDRSINNAMWIMGAMVVFCFVGLFVHADVQFAGKPALNLLLFWMLFIVLCLSTGALLNFISQVFFLKINRANALAIQSKSELQLLQSQLSPHFLFNTLNNLYGLSINDPKKVPDLLLKLSDLLRYSVYEANELFVPLKDEIQYIKNYVEFEKIRIGGRLRLNCTLDDQFDDNIVIAPLLLLVFIENAFKYSKESISREININIVLKVWENQIMFSSENSFDENESMIDKRSSGFGLNNVKKRLLALYPKRHDLKILNEDSKFKVVLHLRVDR